MRLVETDVEELLRPDSRARLPFGRQLLIYLHPFALFKDAGLHIHVPAGAIPKDGPSAGITMATALASVYTGLAVRSDTAMTGEVTLTGLVLPIGGVKEKVLAARRADLRRVILPIGNEKDLRELPENVRAEMEFLFVERVEDVFAAAIPELAGRLAVTAVA